MKRSNVTDAKVCREGIGIRRIEFRRGNSNNRLPNIYRPFVCVRKCARSNILRLTLDSNYALAVFAERLATVASGRASRTSRRASRRRAAPRRSGRKLSSERIGFGT